MCLYCPGKLGWMRRIFMRRRFQVSGKTSPYIPNPSPHVNRKNAVIRISLVKVANGLYSCGFRVFYYRIMVMRNTGYRLGAVMAMMLMGAFLAPALAQDEESEEYYKDHETCSLAAEAAVANLPEDRKEAKYIDTFQA